MNYRNLHECINYILLRIFMNLNNNLKHYETFLFRNTEKTIYTIHINIISSILSKKYKFKLIISKILNKNEIEELINSLIDKIGEQCFNY